MLRSTVAIAPGHPLMQDSTVPPSQPFDSPQQQPSGFDEARLIDKLRAIEALFAGATTDGERMAADAARQRIRKRLQDQLEHDQPVEHRFTMNDMWERKVFLALLRRYDITPYRYPRQRYTTVMARVPQRFVDETLWPEFTKLNATLSDYLSGVTDRVVGQVLHADSSDAAVVTEPPKLPQRAGEAVPVAQPVAQPAAQDTQATSAAAAERKKNSTSKRRRDKKKKRKKPRGR